MFRPGGPVGGVKLDGKETWVDPVVGFRVRKDLNENRFVALYGDLGGFDVGSQFTWQAYGGVGYEFSDRVSGYLMYRYLDVDYDEGGFVWDVVMEGLLFGVGFYFQE